MITSQRLAAMLSAAFADGNGARGDPFLAFNFLVEIGDEVVGGFSEVGGLQMEIEVFDYREGGVNGFVHRIAGPARYPGNLVLKRGLTNGDVLWAWHEDVMSGVVERKNVSIVLLNAKHEELWRWNFVGAYPVRWVGPDLSADASRVAIETLELAHNGLEPGTSGPVDA